MNKEKLFYLQTIEEERGCLNVLEDIPFKVNRIFSVCDVPKGVVRGGHAHKKCHQLLFAMCGCIIVKVSGKKYTLGDRDMALYIPPRYKIDIEFVTKNAVLMVLASEKYDKDDYIYGAN